MEAGIKNEGDCKQNKILLTLLNGTGYIFDAKDYMIVRRKHRIVGSLVGTCATKGWSTNDCTMPVELSPCETRLLLEENLAVLVSKKLQLLREKCTDDMKNYQELLEKRITQQEDTLREEKIKETERNMDKVLMGKRKKLLKQGIPEKEIDLNPSEILEEIRRSISFDRKNALLDIPCAHPEMHDSFKVLQNVPDNTLKYLVFHDFWSRGKYVTCGDSFGADFLIYPGDPLQYHASHIVILLEDAKIRGLDLVTKIRLSVTVNKLCVLAYFDDDDNDEQDKLGETANSEDNVCVSKSIKRNTKKICYQTLTWLGDKDKERRTMPK